MLSCALAACRWSLIAGRLPGRTDNEIKNYWNSHLSKKLIRRGIDPRTHMPLAAAAATSHYSNNRDAAAAAAAPDKTPPPLPVLKPTVAAPPPPLTEQPSSSSGAGVGGDDGGGGDFPAMTGLGAEVFEGLDDPFCALDAAGRGGFDIGCPMIDDGTFSSFLDSLVSENQLADYFGDYKDTGGANDQAGA